MVAIFNAKGEHVADADSDAEACRWFLDFGFKGDTIDTGESLARLTTEILDVEFRYTRSGEVTTTPRIRKETTTP